MHSTFFLWIFTLLQITAKSSVIAGEDVSQLEGRPEFRSVKLQWKFNRSEVNEELIGFLITYCEDQAWGKYRCKRKRMSDDEFTNEIKSAKEAVEIQFETLLNQLRMATNYTVEVSPVLKDNEFANRARSIGTYVQLRTKGFSARAINCFANSSLVEIDTGPFFGGQISVEDSTSAECSVQGDASSSKSSYMLVIDHQKCGSEVHNDSVKTLIVVQENLPILTHSTRRFVILCSYLPETFTVRAGVNLPFDEDTSEDGGLLPADKDVFEVDPSELFDSTNNLFTRNSKVSRALKRTSELEHQEPEKLAHLILMVVLVMVAIVGISCAVWQLVWNKKKRPRRGISYSQEDPSEIISNEIIDANFSDDGTNCVVSNFSTQVPLSLSNCQILIADQSATTAVASENLEDE